MPTAKGKSTLTRLLPSLALFTFALAGCGGGGGGDSAGAGAGAGGTSKPALVADFTYPGSAFLLADTALDIQVSGLSGSTVSCSVSAGSLPAGLSLTEGCRVVGFPTAVGVSTPTIRLTATGYSGFVDKQIQFQVFGPNLFYNVPLTAERASVISALPQNGSSNPDSNWTQPPGVTAVYSVASGAPPTGVTVDRASGELHGIFTTTQMARFTIGVSLASSHGTASFESQGYPINIVLAGLQFFYGPNDLPVSVTAGTAMDLAPLFNFGFDLDPSKYTFGTYRLAADSPALPAGLALDPVTGHLSGTPTVSGSYHLVFEVVLNSQGQSAPYRSSVLDLTVNP